MQRTRGIRWLGVVVVLVVLGAGCEPGPAPSPTPTTSPSPPAASGSPSATAPPATPVPTGASRTQVLAAGNDAFRRGDLKTATELYERVVNTPPGAGESAALTAAVDGLARFRAMVALTTLGEEDNARDHLERLRASDPNGPFTRLAGQFWDQYGMTANVRAACNNVRPQVAAQAGAALATLRDAGVAVEPDAVCSVPG